jgi:hypothetical protein
MRLRDDVDGCARGPHRWRLQMGGNQSCSRFDGAQESFRVPLVKESGDLPFAPHPVFASRCRECVRTAVGPVALLAPVVAWQDDARLDHKPLAADCDRYVCWSSLTRCRLKLWRNSGSKGETSKPQVASRNAPAETDADRCEAPGGASRTRQLLGEALAEALAQALERTP